MTKSAPRPVEMATIDSLLAHLVDHWHHFEPEHTEEGLRGRIGDLHRYNFLLWHEEDIARSPSVTDGRIAQVKRAIDRYNQLRNDCIEKVDDWLVADLAARGIVAAPTAPAATETPGAAIDRLLSEISSAARPLRVFRQMKKYNDPTMNPYLYKTAAKAA